jgi:Tol biopolymer transport system component
LGDSAETPVYVETLPRRGYRFIGTVDGVQSETRARPADAIADSHAVPRRPRSQVAWPFAAAVGVLVLGALVVVVSRRFPPAPPVEPTQFTVGPPEGTDFHTPPEFAVSPDGRFLVFAAVADGKSRLWLKSRGSTALTPVTGTDGAIYPFWSPDSQLLGFFAARQLRKVRIGGGRPDYICDAPAGRGGTWNWTNDIVFAPASDGPLLKVSASGGAAVPITTLDTSRKDTTHRNPHFLPDGKHFLFLAGGGASKDDIEIGSIDSRDQMSTGIEGKMPKYSAGSVLFIRGTTLVARRFDAATRQFKGESITIADDVSSFSVSDGGALAHATEQRGQLTWLDRTGKRLSTVSDSPAFMVALSPDEQRVVTDVPKNLDPQNGGLFLFDLGRPAAERRVTFASGSNLFPVWAPDGGRMVFASTRNGRYQIFRKNADLAGSDELLLDDSVPPRNIIAPTDWSRDGKYLAYTKSGAAMLGVWVLPVSASGPSFMFQELPPGNKAHAHFSPDGRWLAYTSDESGKGPDVYVAPFPSGEPAHQISVGGGTHPLWSHDGKELFFFRPDGALMSARVETGRAFAASVPVELFSTSVNLTIGFGTEYAVSHDGQRFLVDVLSKPRQITMVFDWPSLSAK